jgi:hypothetical protein
MMVLYDIDEIVDINRRIFESFLVLNRKFELLFY